LLLDGFDVMLLSVSTCFTEVGERSLFEAAIDATSPLLLPEGEPFDLLILFDL
jgi:hypothetical protein